MSELRQNLAYKTWVIIAPERGARPHDYGHDNKEKTHTRPHHLDTCPFCPGNESKTPKETFTIERDGGWGVRVIPNKFAALSGDVHPERRIDGVERSISGSGFHEVIIDSPRHNTTIALMEISGIADLLEAYRARYIEIKDRKNVEHLIIFKNHGEGGGTSLEHPHSQLITLPIVPDHVSRRLSHAIDFFHDVGKCVYCTIMKDELKKRARIVYESDHFVSFVQYAAGAPFHSWIMPRRHMSEYDSISGDEIEDLARVLHDLLARFYHGLGDPDYNYMIRSAPPSIGNTSYYHWYITIVPRVTSTAGFELGSGMFINPSLPENDAAFLRDAEKKYKFDCIS